METERHDAAECLDIILDVFIWKVSPCELWGHSYFVDWARAAACGYVPGEIFVIVLLDFVGMVCWMPLS